MFFGYSYVDGHIPKARTRVLTPHTTATRSVRSSVDTSNPATDRHRKTGHHAGELRLVTV
jgi:hypothetical protein